MYTIADLLCTAKIRFATVKTWDKQRIQLFGWKFELFLYFLTIFNNDYFF